MGNEDDTKSLLIGMARMEAKMEQVLESNEKLTGRVDELEKTVQSFKGAKAVLLWVLGAVVTIATLVTAWFGNSRGN